MRTEDFHAWLSRASELTPSQRQQAIDHLSQKQEPDEVIGAIVGPNPPCPHGHHAPCRCWGNAHGLPRYRCRCGACGKTFNALTKPHLARLRRREFWPEYARSMIAGDKVRVAAGRCEGSQEHLPPLAAPVSGHTVRGQASASAWHRES